MPQPVTSGWCFGLKRRICPLDSYGIALFLICEIFASCQTCFRVQLRFPVPQRHVRQRHVMLLWQNLLHTRLLHKFALRWLRRKSLRNCIFRGTGFRIHLTSLSCTSTSSKYTSSFLMRRWYCVCWNLSLVVLSNFSRVAHVASRLENVEKWWEHVVRLLVSHQMLNNFWLVSRVVTTSVLNFEIHLWGHRPVL